MDFGTREKAGALVESYCRVQTRDDDGLNWNLVKMEKK